MRYFVRILSLLLVFAALTGCRSAAPKSEPSAERPSAPAGEAEDFRPDAAKWVGNTGKPQLIEVFSYD